MKKSTRTAAALGALALIGVLTAAPAYAAPDRPLAPVSVEFKLAPDDSSDPQPRWGDGSEWMDGPRIKCSTLTMTTSEWAACVPRASAQLREAKSEYEQARSDWEARQSARSSATQRPTYTPSPTTAAPSYTPPSYTPPTTTAAPKSHSSSIPWPWIGGGGGVVALVLGWVLWRRRALRPAPARGYAGPRPGLRDRALGLLDGLRDRVDPGPRRGYGGDGEDYPPHRAYPSDADPFGGYEPVPAYGDEQYVTTPPEPSPQSAQQADGIDFDELFNRNKEGD